MPDPKPIPKGFKPVWAYHYEFVAPQQQDRLKIIKALLDTERNTARLSARTWEGRFVSEKQVTHILVVSDTPEQDLESNLRLEAALRDLETEFFVSVPLAVDHGDAVDPVSEVRPGAAQWGPGRAGPIS